MGLTDGLTDEQRKLIKHFPSKVVFRFGNNMTLTSTHRVVFPVLHHKSQAAAAWISIEVVPGATPLLLSLRTIEALGAVLFLEQGICDFSKIGCKIKMMRTRGRLIVNLANTTATRHPVQNSLSLGSPENALTTSTSCSYTDSNAIGANHSGGGDHGHAGS